MKVVIVRDRKAAGGGIHHYYEAIAGHLRVSHEFVDVGRAHGFYCTGAPKSGGSLPTPIRLLFDWGGLIGKLLRSPAMVHLNPGLDIKSRKSLRRDAVNLLLAKLFGCKVLVFWRGWDNEACGAAEFPGGNRGWLSRVYRLADGHVVLCSDFRDDLRRWGFSKPVWLETTVVADSLLHDLGRLEVPRDDGVFRILFLSRVEIAKGVFEMLDAFAIVRRSGRGRFHLTIAGDGPALEPLKKRAVELGLENDVEFPGYVTGASKASHLAKASAFCFLSYTEGMPNAVLEAMAAGLPLVTSTAGGMKDILEEGRTGFLLAVDRAAAIGRRFDPGEVAARFIELASDRERRESIGGRNRRLAMKGFSAAEVALRLDRIYSHVLSAPVAPDTVPLDGGETAGH